MAQAIGASSARRILIPFDSCNTRIAMLSNGPLQAFIDQAVRMTTDYIGELLQSPERISAQQSRFPDYNPPTISIYTNTKEIFEMETTTEKSIGQQLQEELTWKFPAVALDAPERVKEAYDFCEPYKAFLSEAKTERECVAKAEGDVERSRLHRIRPEGFLPAGR